MKQEQGGGSQSAKKRSFVLPLNIGLVCAAVLLVVFFVGRVTAVRLQSDTVVLAPQEEYAIDAWVEPAYAFNRGLVYHSDNEEVAMVDVAGNVKAYGKGNAVITATAADGSGHSASLWVRVRGQEKDVAILGGDRTMLVGEQMQLACATALQDEPVVWESSAAGGGSPVVTVSGAGMATAERPGIATVRASTGTGYDEVTILVEEAQQKQPPMSSATPTAEPEPEIVRLMFTGDLMCLYGQRTAAAVDGGFDFTGSFAQVSEVFARADYVVGNLETAVAPSFPYTTRNPENTEGYKPVLNAPGEYLEALRQAGFSAVVTAGNHCCDAGGQGIMETLDSLDSLGIAHTGTFASVDAPRHLLTDVGGIKLAFLSYSEFFNGREGLLSAEERGYMINPYSEERAQADVAAARKAGAEFVVVYTHWGTENAPSVNATQKEHAQALANAGADLIVGAHPHCLQPAEYIEAADGRRVLCMYSLGNFVSSMAQQQHNDTAIAEVELVRNDKGVRLARAGHIPCRVFAEYERAAHVVLPLVDGESQAAQRIADALGSALPARVEQTEEDEWTSYLVQED